MTKSHSKPIRVQALDQASALIAGDRDKEYGSPKENFDRFRTMVNAYLGKRIEGGLTTTDVSAVLSLLKLSRLAHDPNKLDSWRDLVGYGALGFEMAATEAVESADIQSHTETTKPVRRRGRPRKQ